ncbi:MAG: TldD/PmbA family protein [Candidatus Heimdallarchaeota archaeon]|nr:TldD/PmbA family protein [Candidatus Heimdallarchaeota archaeon]MCK4954954.1 TldD/PmbA family protein [Candidatus Heimdallarchaeota archaeon]
MDPLESLLEYSENQGTTYTDIRYGRIEQKDIVAVDGKITSESNCINSGYGIRLLSEGIISFASTPDIKFAEKEIMKAIKVSKLLTNWKKGNSSLADAPVAEASVTRQPKQDWKNIELDDFKEKIKNLDSYVKESLKVDARIETDILFLNWSERFLNSEGSKVYQEYPYAVLTLTGRVMHTNLQIKYYKSFGGMGGIEVLPFDNPEETHNFIEVINNLPTASHVQQGKYNSVLNEDMAWTLVHEVLGHSLEADNVLSGRSFSAGLLGLKIAPSIISVIDDPYIETLGYSEFDSEGIKGRGTLLVDEGILTDFLHSRTTAAAMDTESSSNYRSFSFEFLPQVRMSNFFIEPKDFSTEELFEQVRDGLYIGEGLGGSSEPQTGEYNLDAQYGRTIKKGELDEFILHFQISGNMIDTLSKVEFVGDRLFAQPGSCVKNNQRLFVGSICPKITVSEMRVS